VTGSPAQTAPWLGATGLSAGYREPLLRGVELRIDGGAWFVLGPNGSGKSTLLATLLGLLPPLAGTVAPPVRGDRRQLGYVPQEPRFALALPCTVAEFVAAALADRLPRATAVAAVAGALAAMGAAALAPQDMRRLSLGQRRRVLVARALVRSPRCLVLDEPSANLDARTAGRLVADLDQQVAAGLCVVHVSHDLALAERHATHVAFVADGQVVAGPAASILARPEVRRALGGGP
jgi:ABC-type Mn2+/Zn2+ transport system ATPase subunit